MRRRLRFGALSVAVLIVGILVPAMAGPANAGGPTALSIGVDNTPPTGKDWSYKDFFPNSNITVHQGDVVGFHWSNAPAGFHTTTVLAQGTTPQSAWNNA